MNDRPLVDFVSSQVELLSGLELEVVQAFTAAGERRRLDHGELQHQVTTGGEPSRRSLPGRPQRSHRRDCAFLRVRRPRQPALKNGTSGYVVLFLAMTLHIIDHPLLHDIMARLRDRATSSDDYRSLTYRISTFLVAEATRDLPTRSETVETPLETAVVQRLDARVVAVPVLRAGIGMLQAFVDLVPDTEVGYFGLERDEATAQARRYYEKVPKRLDEAVVFLLDPMLATGGSAAMAIEGLMERGARKVRLVSIVAAPEGVELLARRTPETVIFTAALDRGLNEHKYILPGLGDFGDRLYGT